MTIRNKLAMQLNNIGSVDNGQYTNWHKLADFILENYIPKQSLQEAVDKGLVGIDEEKIISILYERNPLGIRLHERTPEEMAFTIAAARPIKVLDKEKL